MLPRAREMLHEIIPKHFPGNALLPRKPRRRIFQILRQPLALVVLAAHILAPRQRPNGQRQLLLHTPPAQRQNRCEHEVGVCVCARHADFEARALGRAGGRGDQTNRCGAVLQAPGHCHRCPEIFDKAFVAVHRRRDDGHDIRQTLQEACEEMPAQVAEVLDVRVRRVGVGRVAREEVRSGLLVHEGDVHVPAVARQALAGFGHEAWRDAVLAADVLDRQLEQRGAVGHLPDLPVLQRGLVHARPGLCVPAFDVAAEFGARVEHAVVPVLVVDGAGQRVAEHAFFERGEAVHGVVAEVCRGGGGIALVGGLVCR